MINLDKCYVFATYFNHKNDPQRKIKWNSDYNEVINLINSVVGKGIKIKIFHNCFNDVPEIELCEWIRVEPSIEYMPNVVRWFHYLNYIKSNFNEIEGIFMVDSTDVIMLKNPFNEIREDIIYCGDEKGMKVENHWMETTQEKYLKIHDYRRIIGENGERTLINCGVVGGKRKIILDFLEKICENHNKYSKGLNTSSDMSIFNYTIWKNFKQKIYHGIKVNTPFKQDIINDISWWKHK